jgi:hypothetical protein
MDFRRKSMQQKFDNGKNLKPIKINKPKRDDPTYYYEIELDNDIKVNETVQDEQKYYVADNFDDDDLNEIKPINTSRSNNSNNAQLYEKLKKDNLIESVYTKLDTNKIISN